jgi:hypothetical protein
VNTYEENAFAWSLNGLRSFVSFFRYRKLFSCHSYLSVGDAVHERGELLLAD